MATYETYDIKIAGLNRSLRLFQVKPGLKIAILNILGDTELVQACARGLNQKLKSVEFDVIVTAEAKSIPLAYALSVESGKPYIILRKSYKPYMGAALIAETLSITTGEPQTLIMDEKDQDAVHGKRALIVDDVISTGSTLHGMRTRQVAEYCQSGASSSFYKLTGFNPRPPARLSELFSLLRASC